LLNYEANEEESTVSFFRIIVSGYPFVSPINHRPSWLNDTAAHKEITADGTEIHET
jgi:hypothetical protein